MKANECGSWHFNGVLADDSEVKCPDCGEWSPLAEWEDTYVYCETCGDHNAMGCPKCDYGHDHVWSSQNPLEVRQPGDE